MTTPTVQDSTRILWMDAVRGTAILLLLIWHASAVPLLYGQEMPEAIRAVNEFFLPYRMPTLMFLSGMLLTKSIRKPLPQYYVGKFAMIIWPYVIWLVIAKVTFLDVGDLPWYHWRAWYATSYLWFLFFIAVYYLIAPAFRRLPAWVPVLAAAIGGLLLPHGGIEQRMAYFAIFFFAGNWLAQRPRALNALTHRRTILITAVPTIAFGIASCLWPEQLQYTVWGAPASVLGTACLAACFAYLAQRDGRMRVLKFLGRSSIVYYVAHFPVMALLSSWLVGAVDPITLAVINLVAALVVATGLALVRDRAPIRWLFEAPRTMRRALTRIFSPRERPVASSG